MQLNANLNFMPPPGSTVYVAMSGGVDSSVVCALLKRERYNLKAVFMRNWDPLDEDKSSKNPSVPSQSGAEGCQWKKDWYDVQTVCGQLGVDCEMMDFTKEYWNRVFDPSLELWQKGWTPNPDVLCNRYIKFGALLDAILEPRRSGSDTVFLATGHYARKMVLEDDRPLLLRGLDPHKDQSYYLSSVTNDALRYAVFPLGGYVKSEVREIAHELGLHTASRPESMGLCFVGEKRRFKEFLSTYLPPEPGSIVDAVSGKELATHEGLWNFTIGENARIPGQPQRLFVSSKDTETDTIFVVDKPDHPLLHFSKIDVTGFRWINDVPPPHQNEGLRMKIQFRYRSEAVWGHVKFKSNDTLDVTVEESQVSLAEGQIVVLYMPLEDVSLEYERDEEWVCMGQGTASKIRKN